MINGINGGPSPSYNNLPEWQTARAQQYQPPYPSNIKPVFAPSTPQTQSTGLWGKVKGYFKNIGMALIGKSEKKMEAQNNPLPVQMVNVSKPADPQPIDTDIAQWQNVTEVAEDKAAETSIDLNNEFQEYQEVLRELKNQQNEQKAMLEIIKQRSVANDPFAEFNPFQRDPLDRQIF